MKIELEKAYNLVDEYSGKESHPYFSFISSKVIDFIFWLYVGKEYRIDNPYAQPHDVDEFYPSDEEK